jgi:hypothetical protein
VKPPFATVKMRLKTVFIQFRDKTTKNYEEMPKRQRDDEERG